MLEFLKKFSFILRHILLLFLFGLLLFLHFLFTCFLTVLHCLLVLATLEQKVSQVLLKNSGHLLIFFCLSLLDPFQILLCEQY